MQSPNRGSYSANLIGTIRSLCVQATSVRPSGHMERYTANRANLPNMSVCYPVGYSPCDTGPLHVCALPRNSNENNYLQISLGYDTDQDRTCVMNVRPLHDYVIVCRKEEEHLSAGGIVILDTATEKPVQREVVAVGSCRIFKAGNVVPPDAKLGDQVLFGKYAGTEIKVDGEDVLIMREEDILGVFEA